MPVRGCLSRSTSRTVRCCSVKDQSTAYYDHQLYGFAAGAGTQIKITRAVLEAALSAISPQFGELRCVVWQRQRFQQVRDEQYDVRDALREQNVTGVGDCFNRFIYLFRNRPRYGHPSQKSINAPGG